MQSSTQQYEKIAYSYGEEAAYLSVLWAALIAAIVYFFLRYANRSLFKWHTVRLLHLLSCWLRGWEGRRMTGSLPPSPHLSSRSGSISSWDTSRPLAC